MAFTSPAQFIEKMPFEGFALQQSPAEGGAHFFERHFACDLRVRLISRTGRQRAAVIESPKVERLAHPQDPPEHAS